MSMAHSGEMSSTRYTITTNVISGGGSPMNSTNFQMNSTLGQPSPLTPAVSINFNSNPGFWHTILIAYCLWDIYSDDDGDLDGLDLYRFLNPFDGSDLEGFSKEFGRTDCHNQNMAQDKITLECFDQNESFGAFFPRKANVIKELNSTLSGKQCILPELEEPFTCSMHSDFGNHRLRN